MTTLTTKNYIIQEVAYEPTNRSKTKVLWNSGIAYGFEEAVERAQNILNGIESDQPLKMKGKTTMFIAIINVCTWELERAYYLYNGIVDQINEYTFEGLEKFVVSLTTYKYRP